MALALTTVDERKGLYRRLSRDSGALLILSVHLLVPMTQDEARHLIVEGISYAAYCETFPRL
jgi:hypothetical protein